MWVVLMLKTVSLCTQMRGVGEEGICSSTFRSGNHWSIRINDTAKIDSNKIPFWIGSLFSLSFVSDFSLGLYVLASIVHLSRRPHSIAIDNSLGPKISPTSLALQVATAFALVPRLVLFDIWRISQYVSKIWNHQMASGDMNYQDQLVSPFFCDR